MRVERSFTFVDLCGFTGYTHRCGDDAARDVLTEFRALLRTVVDEYGIRVAKWLGDGAMVVSVDANVMVAAVIDLHTRHVDSGNVLAIRTGLTVGHVIVFEGDDYIGSTVNLAARLCDAAGADEIITPAATLDALIGSVPFTPLGPISVAGFEQPVRVARIEHARHERGPASLATLRQ